MSLILCVQGMALRTLTGSHSHVQKASHSLVLSYLPTGNTSRSKTCQDSRKPKGDLGIFFYLKILWLNFFGAPGSMNFVWLLESFGSDTAARPRACLALDWDLSGKKGDKKVEWKQPLDVLFKKITQLCLCVWGGRGLRGKTAGRGGCLCTGLS